MPEEPIVDLFWAVARDLRYRSHHVVSPFGVTPAQARALGQLSAAGDNGLRLNELSGSLRIAPRSTTEVVDALEERELVRREPDAADRRAVRVLLTDLGREVSSKLGRARREEAEAFFGTLGDTDRDTLTRILGDLRKKIADP